MQEKINLSNEDEEAIRVKLAIIALKLTQYMEPMAK